MLPILGLGEGSGACTLCPVCSSRPYKRVISTVQNYNSEFIVVCLTYSSRITVQCMQIKISLAGESLLVELLTSW